jgi:hypothetical protein
MSVQTSANFYASNILFFMKLVVNISCIRLRWSDEPGLILMSLNKTHYFQNTCNLYSKEVILIYTCLSVNHCWSSNPLQSLCLKSLRSNFANVSSLHQQHLIWIRVTVQVLLKAKKYRNVSGTELFTTNKHYISLKLSLFISFICRKIWGIFFKSSS